MIFDLNVQTVLNVFSVIKNVSFFASHHFFFEQLFEHYQSREVPTQRRVILFIILHNHPDLCMKSENQFETERWV